MYSAYGSHRNRRMATTAWQPPRPPHGNHRMATIAWQPKAFAAEHSQLLRQTCTVGLQGPPVDPPLAAPNNVRSVACRASAAEHSQLLRQICTVGLQGPYSTLTTR
eukprot:scaffold109452_cov15-Tisochrysis_lutea.AAC.1